MKELEEALASQRAKSKKTLVDGAAVRERGFAEWLAGLARDVGG